MTLTWWNAIAKMDNVISSTDDGFTEKQKLLTNSQCSSILTVTYFHFRINFIYTRARTHARTHAYNVFCNLLILPCPIIIEELLFISIKNIENNIKKFPINKKINITNHSISILNNLISPLFTSDTDKTSGNGKRHKKFYIRKKFSHPNVIFIQADKGNITSR